MMCMFDDISFMDDLPKHDQYDEEDIKMNFIEKLATYCWGEEDHLQSQHGSLSVHRKYDSNDRSAENLRVSGNTLPLSFSSFQFMKRNSRQVVNSEDIIFFDESVKDVIDDTWLVSDPKSQSLISLDFKIPYEILELETNYDLIQNKSVPLSFNSF